MTVKIEVLDTPYSFKHRLINGEGKHTEWASYTQATFLDGMVGVTPYYHGGSHNEIVTPEQFCDLICTK